MPKSTAGRLAALTIIFGAGLLSLSAVGAQAQSDVVAIVNGEKITEAQLVAELKARFGYQVREQLIQQLVVELEAKKRGLTCTEAEIDDAYARTKRQIDNRARMSGKTFEMWLLEQSLTISAFRQRLRQQILLEKMVKPKVNITDQDVSKYYETNKQNLAREEAMDVSFIAVSTKEEAEKLRADIVAGKITWDKAAKDFNLDPYGRDNGGYLGPVGKGDKELQKVAFTLTKDGEISAVFQEPGMGWLIVRRNSYQAPGIPPFEQVEDDIREMLTVTRTAAEAQKQLEALMTLAEIKKLGDIRPPVELGSS